MPRHFLMRDQGDLSIELGSTLRHGSSLWYCLESLLSLLHRCIAYGERQWGGRLQQINIQLLDMPSTKCRLDGDAKQRRPFQQFYVLQLILYGIHVFIMIISTFVCLKLDWLKFWPTFYSLENSHVEAQKWEVFWFRWFFLFQLGDL